MEIKDLKTNMYFIDVAGTAKNRAVCVIAVNDDGEMFDLVGWSSGAWEFVRVCRKIDKLIPLDLIKLNPKHPTEE